MKTELKEIDSEIAFFNFFEENSSWDKKKKHFKFLNLEALTLPSLYTIARSEWIKTIKNS